MLLLFVVAQSFAIYVFLVVTLSRMGRPLIAGLNPFDYLIVALLGSAVETGLYCGSDSLAAGLVSAATLALCNHCTCFLMNRWPRLRRLLVGKPVILLHDGQVIHSHLRQVHLTVEDVRAAARRRGYDNLRDLHLAVMELNGRIGVVPKKKPKA